MLQWFISLPEFTEMLFYLGKTQIIAIKKFQFSCYEIIINEMKGKYTLGTHPECLFQFQ